MHLNEDPIHTVENLINKNKTPKISLYLIILILLLTIFISLSFIKIDISSQSRGIVRSNEEDVVLNSIVSGRVRINNLANNKTVQKGDTLVSITTDIIKDQTKLYDSLLDIVSLQLKDYDNLLKGKPAQVESPLIKTLYTEYVASKKTQLRKISQAKGDYQRNKKLYEKKVISKQQFENYQYQLSFARDELNSLKKKNIAYWESEKQRLVERQTDITNQLTQLKTQESNYNIIAPITGTLSQVAGIQNNSLITINQNLGVISPNTNLIAETSVTPNDIGWIRKGQKVTFQLDAYNYNQWGFVQGTVVDIDKNVSVLNNTAFFKVRCSIDKKELQLTNGYTAHIEKGMTLTARYFITERTVYDLLFDKIDDWLNPKIVAE